MIDTKPDDKIDGIITNIFNNVPGMISETEAKMLFILASKCSKGAIVEIGANSGRSTVCLAKGSKYGYGVPVISVDPHNGGGATPDPTWHDMGDPGTPDEQYYINQGVSFPPFLETLKKCGVDDIVKPLVNYSGAAYTESNWNKPIELLFVDGDHRYNYVKIDVETWGSHLISGGHILMHDSAYPGVVDVIEKILKPDLRFEKFTEKPIYCGHLI